MLRRQFIINLLSISLLATTGVRAEDHDLVSADFFEEAPLVLTASRMSKPLSESPASVSIITREMIQDSGAREIADLFRLVPGFIVGYHSSNTPVVTYHGLGQIFSRQLQVLVDGRSVFIPAFGGVPWSNLPLSIEDIERIEIIRGPNAVTYGANAFLATINILTRHAAEDFGSRYSITSSDNTNPDIKDAYVRVGYHHEDLDWRLSAGVMNDDGFATINDSKEINKLNFRLDLLSGSSQFLTLQIGASNSMNGKGFVGEDTDIEREQEASNSYLNLLWESIQGSRSTMVRLTHTRQEVLDSFTPPPFSLPPYTGVTTFVDFDRLSNRTDIEFIQSQDMSDTFRVVYGGSLRRDRVDSFFLFNDDMSHHVDTSRLFGEAEWRIDDYWLIDFGATFENSSITSRETSPRLSVIRKLSDRHVLRFVASRARRHPILYEFEGETEFTVSHSGSTTDLVVQTWQGNNQIMPENITSYEIGLRSQLDSSGIASDIKLFSYKITDLMTDGDSSIPSPFGGFVPTPVNAFEARVSGIEFSVDYAASQKLTFRNGLSLLDVKLDDKNANDSFPDRTGFVSGHYQFDKRHAFSAAYYYVDEMSWIDGGDVASINKLDFRYAYQIEPRSETQLELIVQNLLEEYEDFEAENIQERIVLLRISGGF